MSRTGCVMALALACCSEPPPDAAESAPSKGDAAEPKPSVASKRPARTETSEPAVGLGTALKTKIDEAEIRCRGDSGIETSKEHDLALTGTWLGHYAYTEPGSAPVEIEARLEVASGIVTGGFSEPNTFAPSEGPTLSSTVFGEVQAGGRVVLVKTYTGGTDADHSVLYVGQLDDDAHTIEGRWRVSTSSGTFELRRSGRRG